MAVLALLVAAVIAYGNSFRYPFVFDDLPYIAQKVTLHKLWPPWTPMLQSHRPVADYSFAVNYALDDVITRSKEIVTGEPYTKTEVIVSVPDAPRAGHAFHYWAYHVVNVAIHAAAALALFGLIRRTLSRGSLSQGWGKAAWGLALSVAMLWLVHPLQTESVTYIYQRFESLMGLFFLLTFYCFLRAQDSPRAAWWYAGSIGSCLLAMGTKEVAAVIPPLLVWYDRAFLASSWRELVRRRWAFYASLTGILFLLGLLVYCYLPIYTSGGVLVVEGIGPLEYARTQPWVILYYLRLSLWPEGQCLDYSWPVANTLLQIVPSLVIVLGLMGLTVWCIWRRPAWGFLGGWFFLILAPTSSFMPIRDLAFEHRMYLPLAAVLAASVLAGYALLKRLPWYRTAAPVEQRGLATTMVLAATIALSAATHFRNQVYASEVAIWEDIVAKTPWNSRGYHNLGLMYYRAAELSKDKKQELLASAEKHYRLAVEMKPDYYDAHYNLAQLLAPTRPEEAIEHYEISLKARNWFATNACNNLALLYRDQGDLTRAIYYLVAAIWMAPDNPLFKKNLADTVAKSDPQLAIRLYRELLHVRPGDPTITVGLAKMLDGLGRRPEAIEYYRQALKAHPNLAALHYLLARMLPPEDPEAMTHLQLALEYEPGFVRAYCELGGRLEHRGRTAEAIALYQRALQIDPRDQEARRRLAALMRVSPSPSSRP